MRIFLLSRDNDMFREWTKFEIASWIHYGFKSKLDDDNPFELDSEGMLTLKAINNYRIDPTKFEVPNDYDEFIDAIF